MEKLHQDKINMIKKLRTTGHTLSEIKNMVSAGKGTIYKYIKEVKIEEKYKSAFELKRFSSKNISKNEWEKAGLKAKQTLHPLKSNFAPLILSALYWGEGNKTELNLINGDPALIKVFVECLYSIGVKKEDLRVTLRIYEDKKILETKKFWSNLLEIPSHQISNVNILKGKKEGKLQFGMCRVRVKKGGQYFKLIISMINLLKSYYRCRSSMDRTRHS